jgi:hypothetical protein
MKRSALVGGISVAVAALLAAGALAAGGTQACNANNFQAHMKEIPGSAGAGSISYQLRLKNVASNACMMGNHPALQLEKADGKDLPTHVHKLGASSVVTVAAGGTARAELRFSPDIPGPGEPTHGPCEPRASLVLVTLATPGKGATVAQVRPKTSVCSHGSIDEKRLH